MIYIMAASKKISAKLATHWQLCRGDLGGVTGRENLKMRSPSFDVLELLFSVTSNDFSPFVALTNEVGERSGSSIYRSSDEMSVM